jgi:hypothetical protein
LVQEFTFAEIIKQWVFFKLVWPLITEPSMQKNPSKVVGDKN